MVKQINNPKTDTKKKVVRVVKAHEPPSYITLEDGTEVTMKNSVSQIIRHLDQWGENGKPIYTIEASTTITINSPDHLKKEAKNGK